MPVVVVTVPADALEIRANLPDETMICVDYPNPLDMVLWRCRSLGLIREEWRATRFAQLP